VFCIGRGIRALAWLCASNGVLGDRKLDLTVPFWASPLADLQEMGFSRADAVEALLVTSAPTDSVLNVATALDYLVLPVEQRRPKYDAAVVSSRSARPFSYSVSGPPVPPSLIDAKLKQEVARLRDRAESDRRKADTDRLALNREIYKEVCTALIADRTLSRKDVDLLEQLRKTRGISNQAHEEVR